MSEQTNTYERIRNKNIGIRKISLHAIKRSMLTWLDSIFDNKRLINCALSAPICYNHQDSVSCDLQQNCQILC